jgi:hypothetical protein
MCVVPVCWFKRQALEWRQRLLLGMSLPFDKVKDDMVCYSYCILLLYFYNTLKQAKGIAKISLVSSTLENPPAGYTEDIIK